ncbi:winged helix-turn-helix domain-containing protein [Streptomyces sp. NPDC023723]|uniref:ArsR/SmtB family transcription factor n=1 Tax=Streptomyces sp. NPDC023723 TaxID=3154323 RepID=UPI0034009408
MAIRIHFTDADLAHTRLAQAPDPLWEALLSMHLLQTADGAAHFGPWRRTVRRQLSDPVRDLLRFAPPSGYSADFLTPAGGGGGLEAGIGALLSTPRRRFRHDLTELAAGGRPLPRWAGALADGDDDAVTHLARALRTYVGVAVTPWWEQIRARMCAERARLRRSLAGGDLQGLLTGLHPGLVWQQPVLEVVGPVADRDLHLDGHGLLVLPSYFCWRRPTLLKDPALPCVVVYPMTHDGAPDAASAPGAGGRQRLRSVAALLGHTRGEILGAVAGRSRTTTELACGAGVSPATASHHVGVLRQAGLLDSRRAGKAVLHSLTPLGLAVLYGDTARQVTVPPADRWDTCTGP